jgi:hypothetical protein
MKIRFVSILAIAGLFMLSFLSCEKEDEKLDFYLVDVQADTDWDYLAFSKDGSYLLIQQENSIPTQMYFVPEKGNDGYPIFLDDEGFPSMAVIDGHIFLFSKADDTHVDIAMVTPGGEILITRGIEHGADWSEVGTKSADAEESLASMTRWAGRVASVVGCGLSIKAAVATGVRCHSPCQVGLWSHGCFFCFPGGGCRSTRTFFRRSGGRRFADWLPRRPGGLCHRYWQFCLGLRCRRTGCPRSEPV